MFTGRMNMTEFDLKPTLTKATAFTLVLAAILVPLMLAEKALGLGTKCSKQTKFALAVHGGAVWGNSLHTNKETHIRKHLRIGRARLASGQKAIDVVAEIIAAMEDSGLFNAGRGSVANAVGEIEMDASIMDGRHLRAGAVASMRNVKNPITAARLVMDDTPYVMMVGPAADKHLVEIGAQRVEQDYFLHSGRKFADVVLPGKMKLTKTDPAVPASISMFAGVWAGVLAGKLNHVLVVEKIGTDGGDVVVALGANEGLGLSRPITIRAHAKFLNRFLIVESDKFRIAYRRTGSGKLEAILAIKNGGRATGLLNNRPELLKPSGTVGAVALDRCGNLAAGTSTGGFGAKRPGRVGDSPIIGAGTYADNRSVAVSGTGHGEYFIRHAVAHEIAARIRHGGQTLIKAAYQVVFRELKRDGGEGGIIAIDKDGKVVMLYNTDGMVRGWTTDRYSPQVNTYSAD